jgi:CBS domain-containing protein
VRLISEKNIRFLPVVGENGRFRGIVSRDELLRAGVPLL